MNKRTVLLSLLIVVVIIVGAYIVVVINNSDNGSSKVANVNENTNTKFESSEFGYSLEYPADWWHNTVPLKNLTNAPLSAIHYLSLEEFGIGNAEDYKHPFSNDFVMLSCGVSVYSPWDGYTVGDVKNELSLNNHDYSHETIGNYDAIVKVLDDSNHEIESVRMFVKDYYIQKGNVFYEISFAALNKAILDQNSYYIDNILNSFQIGDNVNQEVQENKQVQITSVFPEVIEFEIPSDWNVAYNGDPVLVTDLNDTGGRQSIIASVSVADKPVTYTDINWEQVDFILTDGDLITESFIESEQDKSEQTLEPISLGQFTCFVLDTFDVSMPVSKGNSDGVVYYLKPNVNSPEWDLIIVVQSKGDDQFELGIQMILNSLTIN